MKKRDEVIDIAKGIGIFLVVLGHVPIPMKAAIPIYMFHMPLFFFLSGMFFNAKETFGYGLYKKIRTLIVPYFFFAFCGNLSNVLRDMLFSHSLQLHSIWQLFDGTITPLWFLVCLFFCYLICKLSQSVFHHWKSLCVVSSIWGGIGICLSSNDIRLPLWGTQALLMQFFYVLGYIYKNIDFHGETLYAKCMKSRNVVWISAFVFFIVCCLPFNIRPNVSTLDFYHPCLFVLGAMFGIYLILIFSKKISKEKTFISNQLQQMGNESLFVLGFHFFIIFHFYFFAIPALMRIANAVGWSFEGDYLRKCYWLGILFVIPSVYISMFFGKWCLKKIGICFRIQKK